MNLNQKDSLWSGNILTLLLKKKTAVSKEGHADQFSGT